TIAWPFAAGFHGVARGVYKPLVRRGHGRSLPLRDYVANQADFSFRQNYAIVYDQLAAPAAAYIRGDALRKWFERADLKHVQLSHSPRHVGRGPGRAPGRLRSAGGGGRTTSGPPWMMPPRKWEVAIPMTAGPDHATGKNVARAYADLQDPARPLPLMLGPDKI